MSQTEFAEQLNVTFQTVNRWENGRAVPNKLAQSTMYELCKGRSVPVYEMTLKKIAEATEAIPFTCAALMRWRLFWNSSVRTRWCPLLR